MQVRSRQETTTHHGLRNIPYPREIATRARSLTDFAHVHPDSHTRELRFLAKRLVQPQREQHRRAECRERQKATVTRPVDDTAMTFRRESAHMLSMPVDELIDGPISALCPQSHHAWMAFGHIRANHDLRIYVLGDGPVSGSARLCKTLDYTYHGEWSAPSGPPINPGIVQPPQFPQ